MSIVSIIFVPGLRYPRNDRLRAWLDILMLSISCELTRHLQVLLTESCQDQGTPAEHDRAGNRPVCRQRALHTNIVYAG